MAQMSLSDLCSICHSEAPKYRCPRCKTQTCSLPCYKRHQQRASCSGKRDPAAYVKKNDLATPSGVDRDYNYLKGVERSIEDAGKITSERGIGFETPTWRRTTSSRMPGSELHKYLESNSITVKHAPTGMSRQRNNHTRRTNGGKILWTVEWVHDDGEHSIEDDCHESTSVAELYAVVYSRKRKAKRQRVDMEQQARGKQKRLKRKREQDPGASQRSLDETSIEAETKFLKSLKSDGAGDTVSADANPKMQNDELPNEHAPRFITPVDPPDQTKEVPDGSSTPINIKIDPSSDDPPNSSTKEAKPAFQPPKHPPPPENFYLLKSQTSSPSQVLIPFKSSDSLTKALQNRTILEYPTIYVLSDPPQALREGFVLEEEYLRTLSSDDVKPEGRNSGNEVVSAGKQTSNEVEVDAKSILSMLKRDIGR